MAAIEKIINICKLGVKSSRGYYFNEPAVREFLDSPQWAKRKADRTALGTITHKARRKPNDLNDAKAVGPRDYMLVDKSVVSIITDSWIEDGYWRAKLLILDPDDFAGDTKDDIMFVQGLVKAGAKLYISAGIESYYSPVTKEGEKIYDLVGVDITQSPDFKEGGIID